MDRPSGVGPVQKGSSAMFRRHLFLVRACSAAGLFCALMYLGESIAAAQKPAPAAIAAEPSAPPVAVPSETVDVLQATKAGDLSVLARGQGQEKVHLTIRNSTARRLNVIIPPGLVAAAKVAQGGGAGGRGMQSMGLGSVTNREGAFGGFQSSDAPGGLRSISVTAESRTPSVAVPVGESVDLMIPAVCLNYGKPSPTTRDKLTLMDVDDYTSDPRVRKALRSLAMTGTSHGVAQAVMWRLCNDLPFELMAQQAGKVMNLPEIALAARFVDTLDESSSSDLVDRSTLSAARIFARVEGDGRLASTADRLNGELGGVRVLGMPVQVATTNELPAARAPALAVKVILSEAKTGETRGLIVVSSCLEPESWTPLGKVAFRENSSMSVLDGAALARAMDRAISSAFVTIKPVRRSTGSTTFKVENRLPFTISELVIRAGSSSGAPSVPFQAVGIGPARSGLLPIQAATASLVEHVELNGL
jgi:hypothetical protein